MWIPENIIIRNVEQYHYGKNGNDIPVWLDKELIIP